MYAKAVGVIETEENVSKNKFKRDGLIKKNGMIMCQKFYIGS